MGCSGSNALGQFTKKYYNEPQKFTAQYNFAAGEENELFTAKFKSFRHTNCLVKIDDKEYKAENAETFKLKVGAGEHKIEIELKFNEGIETMDSMFEGNEGLVSIDLTNFGLKHLKSLKNVFCGCKNLKTVTMKPDTDVSMCEDFSNMFAGCSSLETIELSSWNIAAVANTTSMFEGCTNLKTADISKWDLSKVPPASCAKMFANCPALTGFEEIVKKNDKGMFDADLVAKVGDAADPNAQPALEDRA